MAAWIPVTLFAALAQTVRFVLQKQLRTTALSTAGATFSRFLFSWPLLIALALGYAASRGMDMPNINPGFWVYGLAGAIGQITATMCTVALFQHRNFAVGVTFKKTEVLQTVMIGFVFLGETVSWGAMGAILIGLVGVLALSDTPTESGSFKDRFLTPATGLGLASGVLFGVAAVGYRGAALELEGGDVFLRAAFGLAILTLCQTAIMTVWLVLREPGEMGRVLRAWRVAGLVGATSMLGSLGWFTAFGLQKAAYVKALGQSELLFSFLASTFFFGERSTARELFGIGALCLSVVLIILLG
ncbi:DMT family transporter [Shimia ponticola]|uniref:DMT family transporter n=1 Tax=Shimia ponticola TaxID=2582893 RepID=UPI0011BFCF7C|nr:DMT family transporter [Shimia ponticola]